MADPNTGCFERFWMAGLAVVMAMAIAAGIVIFNTNRVTAQDTDWSQFVNGMIYLVKPVAEVDRYHILETPRVQDGFLCTVIDQYEVETCFPLTNIAGIMAPS